MNQKSLLTEKENPQMDQESIKLDVSRKKSFERGGGVMYYCVVLPYWLSYLG